MVNGDEGDFLAGLATTDETEKILSDACVRNDLASSLDVYVAFHFAINVDPSIENIACVFKLGLEANACISLSLSTISLTATDCTRPALSQVLIFFHNNGDN